MLYQDSRTSPVERSLADLAAGESATVRSVDGRRPLARRLLEMGLTPGARVEMVRRAPLGDPLEVRLRGYRLSLRMEEASRVLLEGTTA